MYKNKRSRDLRNNKIRFNKNMTTKVMKIFLINKNKFQKNQKKVHRFILRKLKMSKNLNKSRLSSIKVRKIIKDIFIFIHLSCYKRNTEFTITGTYKIFRGRTF